MIAEDKPRQSNPAADTTRSDFIRDRIEADLAAQRYAHVHTRFPPEPNGYLHIGHAKAIMLSIGIAREFAGTCNLRYDDTNPTKEKLEYVDSILEDVRWLIDGWADDYLGLKPSGEGPRVRVVNGRQDFHLPAANEMGREPSEGSARNLERSCEVGSTEPFYASDYFDQIYAYAVDLIRKGSAYVCDLSAQEMAAYRGSPDEPGKNSPFRGRLVDVNLKLFAQMRDGEFPDGERTLRAKIDMASPNVWMRDPILYRIRHAEHHRTGRQWPIYPMYDFAHCLSDYIEGVTHSLCTLEFEVHRPLYDWILKELQLPRPVPHQHEFARFNLSYTVMSKRKLMQLVSDRVVSGWDDPRLPTISGIRRRGVPPRVLRNFALNLGITKYKSLTQVEAWEHAIRAELNRTALRRFVVLRPLRVIVSNYPEQEMEWFEAIENPEDPGTGTRRMPFSRTIFIEQEDFSEAPSPGYFRLRPGGEVRLKHAYIIKCDQVVKDGTGAVTELHCTADLNSKTGGATASRKMNVGIHWVDARHAVEAEVRLYDRLFTSATPEATGDFMSVVNPDSLDVVRAKCEPSISTTDPKLRYQFERLGYFALDRDSAPGRPVFNRTVALKHKWPKRDTTRRRDAIRLPAPQTVLSNDLATRLPARLPDKVSLTTSGRLPRIAKVRDEYYRDVLDPEELIKSAKAMSGGADLLTFIQRPPNTIPKFGYHFEWEGIAALPLRSFDHWWQHQISKETRRKVQRAEKAGVVVRHVPLDDELVRGITKIYNEAPVKRGKPNRHYGKGFDEVKIGMSRESDRSTFIGAYFEEELIGIIKAVYADVLVSPVTNLAMFAHRDKMTNYALLAELVRLASSQHIPYVFYGLWKSRREGMREFLTSNGFAEVKVPRYYIPLTRIGLGCLRVGAHRPWVDLVPENLMLPLLALRSRWYASRHHSNRRNACPPA